MAMEHELFDGKLAGKRNQRRPILLRTPEAASLLAISPRTLWELTNRVEIPCLRIGRAVRYAVDDLEQWVKTRTA